MALPETPLTRGEQYLAKAAGQDVAIPNVPLTRIEQYLAKIAGQDVAIPNVPLTRLEQYLAHIAEKGGGGVSSFLASNDNLLQGVNYEDGYISTSGTPVSASATKEIRFDPISVVSGKTYYFYLLVPNVVEQWIGVAWYGDSDSFISRQDPIGMMGSNPIKTFPYQQFQLVAPNNAKKMRFTCRSYGLAQVLISDTKPNVTADLADSAVTATSV